MLNFDNFDQKIIEKKAIAVICFVADWCKPSLLQQDVIKEIAEEYGKSAIIELVNVDKDEKLADRFNARTLPTTAIFAEGELIEILPGYQPLDFLQSYLKHIFQQQEKMKEKET
ncbi:MAG: thioredoxin family protein [Candidatus Rifleibacteriota bacterium]